MEQPGTAGGRRQSEVVLEVVERPTQRGCSETDRRTFRQRTIPRLLEEFAPGLTVVWKEPAPGTCTAPSTFISGQLIQAGGYIPWEILRPAVAWALALQGGMDEFVQEAEASLAAEGIEAADWQEGLLAWLRRRET
jgi:hypothetical protein